MGALTIAHVNSTAIGYGRLGVKLVETLSERGLDVYTDNGALPPDETVPPSEVKEIARRRRAVAPTRSVTWVSVPTHARWWWKGQHRSLFSMWEASVLPESFRENMHEFETIMVPSEHNLELFSRHHPNVHLVPLGVDPGEWHYRPRRDWGDEFRFLVGGSGARKGTDLAYRAFRKVFPDPDRLSPRPRLVMKGPKSEGFYGPGIETISGRISDEDEQTLYGSCHVYLQPSRGEGFGLQPLQAMAQGMPTILTNAHGHAAFARFGIPLDWSWSEAEYFLYGDAGEWWEPDFEQLCEAMWATYQDYEDYLVAAEFVAKSVIPTRWTWNQTAGAFLDALGDVVDEPPLEDPVYEFPSLRRFLVRVRRAWDADIGGVIYYFQPGRDYYEPADVKRILFENQILDPSCLRIDDPGLSEDQLGRVEEYAAECSFCPTCGQQMNTLPTKTDWELEKILAAGRVEAVT